VISRVLNATKLDELSEALPELFVVLRTNNRGSVPSKRTNKDEKENARFYLFVLFFRDFLNHIKCLPDKSLAHNSYLNIKKHKT
jgi:hypothetical protein